MKFYLVFIISGILFGITYKSVSAEINNAHLTPFHPISQAQYDAILGLTSGEPFISEARLIASGLAILKGLAAGLSVGFSTSWLPSIFTGAFGASAERNATADVLNLPDSYPLCVVKTTDEVSSNVDQNEKTFEDHEHAETEHSHNNQVGPFIKCIMVVKQEVGDAEAKPTAPPVHHHNTHYAPVAYSHPVPPPPPPPPYPYSYPWFGNYYAYPPPYGNGHGHVHGPDHHEQADHVPNYRYYPNHYDASYHKHPEPGYSSSSHHKSNSVHKTKSHKPKRTYNRNPNPAPVNYYDYTAPPTVRRRKTKRDQHSANMQEQGNNYAQITNYPAGGYQPTTYPQISYHSQYPKVAYSPSYNYPSPVYVGTTPRSQRGSSSEESV